MPRLLCRPLCALALLMGATCAVQAQIPGGTYTLGPSAGNDFGSFTEVFDTLQNDGVSGPVVIEVEQATYGERVALGNIPGASATNTVTFLGIASGTTLPLITETPSASEPYLVALQKANWVTLDNLRFEVADENQSRGTLLLIEADDVTVQNCEFKSIDDDAVGANDAVNIDVHGNRVVIQDNEIDEGDIGIRFGPTGGGGTTSGGQVLRNNLDRTLSVGILAEDQSVASGNAISIRENFIDQDAPDQVGWVGIWVRDHNRGAVIARNRVIPRSGTGIRVEDITIASTNYVAVVNNMVSAAAFGIQPGSGIEVLNTDRARIQNNSVRIGDQDGTALFVDAASDEIDIRNNILVHAGEGRLVDVESEDSIFAMDYQAYQAHEQDSKFLARWQGVDYTDFALFVSTAGRDDHGIVWPVEFQNEADLHLDGRSDGDGRLIGTPLPSSVPFDYDGDARNATRPYRGADEAATPLADPPPFMSGTYFINSGGGGATTYTSFGAALDDLDLRGVNGPVTFIVQSSLFIEQINMGPVPGVSSANPITFEAESGTPQIKHDASNLNFDYVMSLIDVENVTFRRLAFRSQDDTYSDVVQAYGGKNVTFDECVFIADSPDARGLLMDISGRLNASNGNADSFRILNSTFDGGYSAINVSAVNANIDFHPTGGHEIIGNTISDLRTPTFQSYGINVSGTTAARVLRNRIEAPASNDNFVGISLGGSSTHDPPTSILVEQNEVIAHDGTGIHWERFDTSTSPPGVELRLANNTVRMTGNGPTVGLLVQNAKDLLTAYNTVSVASTDPASTAGQVLDEVAGLVAELDLRNNIFDANLGRALDLEVGSTSSRYVYDYNVFWSNGAVLASYDTGYFEGDCADIACIRAASEAGPPGTGDQDNDSIVKQVAFANVATGNLRLGPSMDGDTELVAQPIPSIPTDIDGEARASLKPYRGADERPALLGFIIAEARVALQGAYPTAPDVDGFADAMSTDLLAQGLIPLSNPYALPDFDGTVNEYDGSETVTQAFLEDNPNLVDWVVVGLRTTPTGTDLVKRAVFVNRNGTLVDLDGDLRVKFTSRAPGSFYIVVYHRNHLPIMTAQAEFLNESGSTGSVRMYRENEIYGGASGLALLEDSTFDVYGMISGDANGDGSVLADDETLWRAAVGEEDAPTTDFNLDGSVLADDQQVKGAPNLGAQSAVPGAVAPLAKTSASRRTPPRR